MNNDKNKGKDDGFKLGNSGRDRLDDEAQRVRIERDIANSKNARPQPKQEEEPDEDDWSHLNHLN